MAVAMQMQLLVIFILTIGLHVSCAYRIVEYENKLNNVTEGQSAELTFVMSGNELKIIWMISRDTDDHWNTGKFCEIYGTPSRLLNINGERCDVDLFARFNGVNMTHIHLYGNAELFQISIPNVEYSDTKYQISVSAEERRADGVVHRQSVSYWFRISVYSKYPRTTTRATTTRGTTTTGATTLANSTESLHSTRFDTSVIGSSIAIGFLIVLVSITVFILSFKNRWYHSCTKQVKNVLKGTRSRPGIYAGAGSTAPRK